MRYTLPGQLELADTSERIADLAKRKATAPLQASKPQAPCDLGLFSDSAAQSDLLDMLGGTR